VQELASGACGAIALAFADAHAFDDAALLAVAFAHAETGAPVPEEEPRPAGRLARFTADLATFGIDVDEVLGDGADTLFTPPAELVDA
jgi:hypothetical protein